MTRFAMTRLTLTTIALLAGTALASAQGLNAQHQQGGNDTKNAAPAPTAQQNAPAEKMAPHQAQPRQAQMPQSGKSETTGQAPKADVGGKADMKANDKTEMKANDKSTMDTKTKAGDKSTMDTKTKVNETNKSAAETDKSKAGAATTGQGAAGARGAANLSTEQRTKIRTVIKEKVHAQPVTNVNFSVSVGTRVPRTVHFYPLPVEVVSIYPQWRGYEFILVGDEIVIIEPSSYEIVAVINA